MSEYPPSWIVSELKTRLNKLYESATDWPTKKERKQTLKELRFCIDLLQSLEGKSEKGVDNDPTELNSPYNEDEETGLDDVNAAHTYSATSVIKDNFGSSCTLS